MWIRVQGPALRRDFGSIYKIKVLSKHGAVRRRLESYGGTSEKAEHTREYVSILSPDRSGQRRHGALDALLRWVLI